MYYKDFWEYDLATDTWTRKADFGGTAREGAVGFSIGNKGYIGTGVDSTGYENDFWEYNPAIDKWTQKVDFGGAARTFAVGFSIGGRGYIGTGVYQYYGDAIELNDFWQYDTTMNTWTQIADFVGEATFGACGFSIGGNGFVENYYNFWQYDATKMNTWTQKDDYIGYAESFMVGCFYWK